MQSASCAGVANSCGHSGLPAARAPRKAAQCREGERGRRMWGGWWKCPPCWWASSPSLSTTQRPSSSHLPGPTTTQTPVVRWILIFSRCFDIKFYKVYSRQVKFVQTYHGNFSCWSESKQNHPQHAEKAKCNHFCNFFNTPIIFWRNIIHIKASF